MPKNVIIAAALPASPERLFDMYLDPGQHGAFTGKPVTIGTKPGDKFEAFDGAIHGTILHTEPRRLIVQTWRSINFPDDAMDSTLILTFFPDPAGGRIELNHINVPEVDFAGVSEGWLKHYWRPWRDYLEGMH
jgi:uncharacterized protein YndB with AHSA1/START domain